MLKITGGFNILTHYRNVMTNNAPYNADLKGRKVTIKCTAFGNKYWAVHL